MIPKDKLYHASVGAAVGLLSPFSIGWSVLLCLVLAIGKEVIWDWYWKKGTPEFLDVFATVVGWALMAVLLTPFHANAAEIHLDYVAAIDPGHHENHVGNKGVERYYLEVKPSIEWGRLHYYVALQYQGAQKWRSPEVAGGGVAYYQNPDTWKIENWYGTVEHGGTFDLWGDKLQIYSKLVNPIDRHSWGAWYWWRVGFSGRFF